MTEHVYGFASKRVYVYGKMLCARPTSFGPRHSRLRCMNNPHIVYTMTNFVKYTSTTASTAKLCTYFGTAQSLRFRLANIFYIFADTQIYVKNISIKLRRDVTSRDSNLPCWLVFRCWRIVQGVHTDPSSLPSSPPNHLAQV